MPVKQVPVYRFHSLTLATNYFPKNFKLPASQNKTVSLSVHHPYPFLDVNLTEKTSEQCQSEDDLQSSEESEDIQEIRDNSALPECNDRNRVLEALDVERLLLADDWTSDLEGGSGSDHSWDHSDGVWDSEFRGYFDEERNLFLEDIQYLEAVRDGCLPHDGDTGDNILRDANIQAFFDNVLQAFQAVLNKISATFQLLAVYWTSFKPLQIHKLCYHCLVSYKSLFHYQEK